jgi:hypothetical protein
MAENEELAADSETFENESELSTKAKRPAKDAKKKAKSKAAKKAKKASDDESRTRTARPYPASSFTDALPVGEAIMKFASGERVRRLTLLEKMNKSPNSGPTRQMITNSGKYGITTGSYATEYLELTEKGKIAVDTQKSALERRRASFDLAIDGIAPFKLLYDHYKDKRLPEREVMKDVLKDSNIEVPDTDECVDTFTVNVKDLGMLRTIGGAETLVAIAQVLEELPDDDAAPTSLQVSKWIPTVVKKVAAGQDAPGDWQKICFYITPIGSEDSVERKHADLFMSSLVQPALEELGLIVVRADQIGEPGMITTQVLEYLKRAKLAIADLSYLNPNVFYEVALRHALRLPVVQVIRKADRLPFDVNQSRTLTFDTTDIYTLIPKLQTYRAEIANQARKALEDPESVGNPVSVFYPDFYK